MNSDISLCVTVGGRPDLLDQTLESLLSHNRQCFSEFLFVNDAGDEETNQVIFKHVPSAKLFFHASQRGQHVSVDEMYAAVSTPLIFHCEDDWLFDPVCFVPSCRDLLLSDVTLSQVTVRHYDCYESHNTRFEGEILCSGPGDLRYYKHGKLRIQDWGHFTFNPSLLRKDLWSRLGAFAKYYRESDINDACMLKGLTNARLLPGYCRHIGVGRHVDEPPRRKNLRTYFYRNYKSLLKGMT